MQLALNLPGNLMSVRRQQVRTQNYLPSINLYATDNVSHSSSPAPTFKFVKFGSFGGRQGLVLNEISEANAPPSYITDLMSTLREEISLKISDQNH
jgi:hypothetical protein